MSGEAAAVVSFLLFSGLVTSGLSPALLPSGFVAAGATEVAAAVAGGATAALGVTPGCNGTVALANGVGESVVETVAGSVAFDVVLSESVGDSGLGARV